MSAARIITETMDIDIDKMLVISDDLTQEQFNIYIEDTENPLREGENNNIEICIHGRKSLRDLAKALTEYVNAFNLTS